MKAWELGHRPGLDGLRAVAVIMVIAAHYGVRDMNSGSAGTAGVTVFFTLSGFLITSLLLQESAVTGTIAKRAFYRRRALRLVPALLVCLALAIALEIATTGRVNDWDMIVGGLTYTANFLMMDGQWGEPTFVGHMWSLSIEEQFYLLWPFALLLLTRLSRLRVILVLGYAAAIATVLRFLLWDDGAGKVRNWMGLDTRSDALLIGCLLSVYLTGRPATTAGRGWAVAGGVTLALLLPWRLNPDLQATSVTTPLVAALATACLIYGIVNREPGRILGSTLMTYLGRRSYGLYLYHVPIQVAVQVTVEPSMLAGWLWCLPPTLIVAALSYRYVEQPFLRRKALGPNLSAGSLTQSGALAVGEH